MNTFSENEFFEYNKSINERVSYYHELKEKNDPRIYEELGKITEDVRFYAIEMIDASNGFINTANEDIKELFKKLFNQASKIVQFANTAAHDRSSIKKAQSDTDLDILAQHLYMSNQIIRGTLDNLYELTTTIKEYAERTKKTK